jgi:hypothetical protein
MLKWILSVLIFLVTLAVLAFFGFFLAIFLAGPHSDILPEYFKSPAFITILFVVLAIPSWLAYKIFQRLNSRKLS